MAAILWLDAEAAKMKVTNVTVAEGKLPAEYPKGDVVYGWRGVRQAH